MNEIVESSGSKMEERKTPFKVSFDDVTEDIVKVQMNSNFGVSIQDDGPIMYPFTCVENICF